MDLSYITAVLYDVFVSKLDYNITYISIMFILFFYATPIVRHLLKGLKLGFVTKFAIFSVFLIVGTNPVFTFLTNTILLIESIQLKWAIISCLLLWTFIKFDELLSK